MNRVIKFRAWDSNRNYFLPLDDDGDYYFRDDNNGLELWDKRGRCKAAILQQFTGLLDKNGKEIYEGDIVESRFLKCEMSNNGMELENNRDFCAGHHIERKRFVASCDLDPENNLLWLGGGQELPDCFIQEEDSVPEEYKSMDEMTSDIGLLEIIGNIFDNPDLTK